MKRGAKKKYSEAQYIEVKRLKATGITIREIAEAMNVPSTFVQEVLSPRKK
jgi:hypothetical protein